MTSDELEAEGLTDAELAEEYERIFGKSLKLNGDDGRRLAYDMVTAAWWRGPSKPDSDIFPGR